MQGIQTILPVGSIVQERYIVEDLLGKGGCGAVYLVRDQRVKGNLYALKEVIDPNKDDRAHFTFEGEVLKRLDHPALPRVYRTFDDDKNARAYMLMDYIEGPNLQIVRQQQPEDRYSLPQAIHIMAPIFDAVSYLHKQEPPIVHRDIKPANIIVPAEGDGAVLVDFGIAKEYEQEGTTTAIRRCSPGYGAPEQYAKGTNPRTDIYGLGATLYTLLVGQVPIDALYRAAQLGSKLADPLLTELVQKVPPHVANAIHRAMAIKSDDRFASVEEFWQALNARPVENEAPAPVIASAPAADPYYVADHVRSNMADVPTVASYRQTNLYPGRRRGAFILLFASIALLALLIGVIFGIGLFPGIGNSSHQVTKITPGPSQKVTATSAASTRVVSSAGSGTAPTAPAATTTPVSTSNSGASKYPQLAKSYQGSLVNKFTNPSTSSTMSLSQIKQNGTNISGHFTVGPELTGTGDFTGMVSADNKIQFTVPGSQGNLPLFFQGQIQADGTISGTYCSYQNNQCNYSAGGYGDWKVASSSPAATLTSTESA